MSQFEKKNPKRSKTSKTFAIPKWHRLASEGSNGDGEGSAVVSRKENAVRNVRGKPSLSKFNGGGGCLVIFY